ncbi:CRISPR-associated endonuclease Cas3'' [Verrucomicrobia bacterium S94]|nr:CRISPR-associated endonuclease Cas3'' [Verrucomicrobia bacterium S94]
MSYYAHSNDGPPSGWQPLEEHLKNVADRAAEFAKPFGGEEWARLAGLWHDLGKYHPDFQRKLKGENIRVVHSEAGGHLAMLKKWRGVDVILSWLIMGHHAGLADYSSAETGAKGLESKMRDPHRSDIVLNQVPESISNQIPPANPSMFENRVLPPDQAFLIRMLYSCLVDADFLDTEVFMDASRKAARPNDSPSMDALLVCFDAHMARFEGAEGAVNQCRAQVLAQCRTAAEQAGTFSLTVPTGGGKTLASLAFALRHAVEHQKRRIIYVIPYTSIIEQTAEVFRSIPGFEDVVLEHHSNLVFDDDQEIAEKRARLAMENWDAPIVVTTNVQFFESLHANRSSRCRKLHNIANSVVIFDEAQCLPPAFLRPCVFAIRELARHYGVTPVLCTATQPVLTETKSFDFEFTEGFDQVTEIIDKPNALSQQLARVQVEVLNELNPIDLATLADQLESECSSLLCIVNRKADARTLAELLPGENTIQLSTNLCAAHRFEVLAEIRQRLKCGEYLLVISTSLVEAGVDLDFPVVYRALAGLDSIAQAAGRCNREGKLKMGRTVVFMPGKQPDYVKPAASLALNYLKPDRLNRIFLPETFRSYFKQYFFMKGTQALDQKGIRELLPNETTAIRFQTAAERFHLIDSDWQLPVIMPFREAVGLVDRLLSHQWEAKAICRKLQRYTVNISKRVVDQLVDQDYARPVEGFEGMIFLHTKQLYDERFGFIPPDSIEAFDPETNII